LRMFQGPMRKSKSRAPVGAWALGVRLVDGMAVVVVVVVVVEVMVRAWWS
jgi:hypothetical protein